VVYENFELLESFMSRSHDVTLTLLTCLSKGLKLRAGVSFEEKHRDGEVANTILVLLHYPKNTDVELVGHNKHTDIGSLTLLFTEQWGLQVLMPETKKWMFVEPRSEHAIINVGDSLRFLSGKRFYSCLHRIIPPNGQFQHESRYSIAYFLRPESSLSFEDTDGNEVTAQAWHDQKYVMFGEPHTKQDESTMLTGGMEQVLN